MLNHQVGQSVTINQNNFLGYFLGVGDSGVGEIAGGDENSFMRLLASQGTDETLDLLTADGVLPTLGLHINHIQPQPVFVDQSVDAFVVGCLGNLGCFERKTYYFTTNLPIFKHRSSHIFQCSSTTFHC